MFYFSELINKKVVSENKKKIGKLKDFIFLAEDAPTITKILVKKGTRKPFAIEIKNLKEIGNAIVVLKDYEKVEVLESEFSLAHNLLNKQIIDVAGGKVVRVNDVAIQDREDKSAYYIAGVDVGFRAILRWFHLEKPALPIYKLLHIYSHPHFLSWADIESLELSSGNVLLKKNTKDLERMRPEDLADYLEKTNIRNVNKIIGGLNEEYAADVIEDLNVNYQTALFKRFTPERASKLIDILDPDEAVDILLTLPKEKRHEIIESLDVKKQKELRELIKYSKTSVGKLINPEFVTVLSEDNCNQAIEKIKENYDESKFSTYIYALNNEEHLVGVLTLARLITQPSDTPVYKVMEQDVVVCHLTTPKEIALKRMLKYKLYALPVIEDNKKIIGVVTFDDMVEEIMKKL
jgi:CBS domain-containing protein/sporulation protein YlmC with PRC-barrel domain